MSGNHENALIAWIGQNLKQGPEVWVGQGDDAALVGDRDNPWLVACDTINDGVHFDQATTPPELIGRKALAVNLSDIAAMGGTPQFALVGAVLPRTAEQEYARALLRGMEELARQFQVSIVGGDTTTWDGLLSLTVTILGRPHHRGPVLRSGGRAGDALITTGPLGGSLSGGRHLLFQPRLQLATYLLDNYQTNAMLDLSDGLAEDLPRLARASGCGFHLKATKVPIHADVPASLGADERVRRALCDGEDFELLLAVSPAEWQRMGADPYLVAQGMTKIGELTTSPAAIWTGLDGRVADFSLHGYEHHLAP